MLAENVTADEYRTDVVGDDEEDICLFFIDLTAFEQLGTVLASHGKAEEEAGEQNKGTIPADRKQTAQDGSGQTVYILQIAGMNEYVGQDGKGKQCGQYFLIPEGKPGGGCGYSVLWKYQDISGKYNKTYEY